MKIQHVSFGNEKTLYPLEFSKWISSAQSLTSDAIQLSYDEVFTIFRIGNYTGFRKYASGMRMMRKVKCQEVVAGANLI
jgi:hypothetical protein